MRYSTPGTDKLITMCSGLHHWIYFHHKSTTIFTPWCNCYTLPYSGFLLLVKTFVNLAFLWWFVKFLFEKINLESVQDIWHPGKSHVTHINCSHVWKSSLLLTMALFAYSQRADSVLPNPDGTLSTAVHVVTVRAANKEAKPVLQWNPSLRTPLKWGHLPNQDTWPSDNFI